MFNLYPFICIDRQRDRPADGRRVQPIRKTLPKGKKQRGKKMGRVTPDQREALLWPTGAQVFEVRIKIHTE